MVSPPREILTNQGLDAPSRGTKNNQGLVAPLTVYSSPHLPLLRPFYPHPQSLEDGGPPYNVILNWTELNWTEQNLPPPPCRHFTLSLSQEGSIILHALIYSWLNLLFIR